MPIWRNSPFHAEGARLIGHDRHDVLADALVLEQRRQHAHERHRGRDLALSPLPSQHRIEALERRHGQRRRGRLARRQVAAELRAVIAQIAHLLAVLGGLAERQSLRFLVADTGMLKRSRSSRSESSSSFFCWCATIWPSAGLAQAESLDGLRQDHGRRALGAPPRPSRPQRPCCASWPPRFRRQISSSDMLATISLSSGSLPKKCSRV